MTMGDYIRKMIFAFIVIISMLPTAVHAQEPRLYGDRLLSKDGRWLLPVATLHLSSDEKDHINRNSVQSWDLTTPKNSPVFSIADGVVELAAYEPNASHGYGEWLYIKLDTGEHIILAHCIQGSTKVKTGQRVTQWTELCRCGFTGKTSFGPHTHFELHKPGGGRYDIGQFWDIKAMSYEKFANARSNEVVTQIGVVTASGQRVPVNAAGQVAQPTEKRPVTTVADATKTIPMLAVVFYKLGSLPDGTLYVLIVAFLLLVLFCGTTVRKLTLGGVICLGVLAFTTESPLQVLSKTQRVHAETQQVTQQVDNNQEKQAFEIAYGFLGAPGVEGKSCTNDGAHTFAGVTQGAFNVYVQRHGLPGGDVCRMLTEEIKKGISYDDYWIKSGAGELAAAGKIALAISMFDWSFNAGAEAGSPPRQYLAQCGGVNCDVKEYNQMRRQWYSTRKTAYLYNNGWQNRVNKLEKLISDKGL